ncbi:response regulator transcription factor [Lapillicoccus jejuensis]|uniref:LuxR family two component transcriptional regulator n=1 Tax=Lapillicoccus jejuensis TaxID=402171 RepID=A0A542DXS9_9MICO|nr:response regulator transcription factor [Lapillicoccus jejuensis]TQJ07875.1 LuxR family two component transcriptional regulator [Lapillicoccus jejuensis]
MTTADHVRPLAPTAGPVPRVALVDDSPFIRDGARLLQPEVDVVASYPSVEELLAARPDVDVVLLDLRLHPGPGVSAQGARGVREVAATGAKVLVYTEDRRRMVLAGCLAAGASGVAHKSDPVEWVVDAVRTVARGGVSVTPAVAGVLELAARRGALAPVTGRKLQVLRARARGESFKGIGSRLHIAPSTAEDYMAEVTRLFADYLREHSPADLERHLGVGEGDVLDPDESPRRRR